MLQKLHYSSTIQIHAKTEVQFQELKCDWIACIDTKKIISF